MAYVQQAYVATWSANLCNALYGPHLTFPNITLKHRDKLRKCLQYWSSPCNWKLKIHYFTDMGMVEVGTG